MTADHPLKTLVEIRNYLVLQIAGLRKRDPSSIDPSRPFNELGIDSLDAITLIGDLEARLGIRLDPAELFDYPTPNDLCRMLIARISTHV